MALDRFADGSHRALSQGMFCEIVRVRTGPYCGNELEHLLSNLCCNRSNTTTNQMTHPVNNCNLNKLSTPVIPRRRRIFNDLAGSCGSEFDVASPLVIACSQ